MGKGEFLFLLQGLKWTLALAAIAFICGTVFGLAVALARTSECRVLERVTAGYIAVFQGTPLLMQLFVVYYALALAGLRLESWEAVAAAFTLHASAYLGEIWRGSIQAVPHGQMEAAKALSLGYVSRMKDVILPQAIRISLPATIGFLVQLIKGTSLAAFVGFTDSRVREAWCRTRFLNLWSSTKSLGPCISRFAGRYRFSARDWNAGLLPPRDEVRSEKFRQLKCNSGREYDERQ